MKYLETLPTDTSNLVAKSLSHKFNFNLMSVNKSWLSGLSFIFRLFLRLLVPSNVGYLLQALKSERRPKVAQMI